MIFFIEQVKAPIIVAGYKVDINEAYDQNIIEEITSPIMKQYREIETSIMWSAQDLDHVIWLVREILNFKHFKNIHILCQPFFENDHPDQSKAFYVG